MCLWLLGERGGRTWKKPAELVSRSPLRWFVRSFARSLARERGRFLEGLILSPPPDGRTRARADADGHGRRQRWWRRQYPGLWQGLYSSRPPLPPPLSSSPQDGLGASPIYRPTDRLTWTWTGHAPSKSKLPTRVSKRRAAATEDRLGVGTTQRGGGGERGLTD